MAKTAAERLDELIAADQIKSQTGPEAAAAEDDPILKDIRDRATYIDKYDKPLAAFGAGVARGVSLGVSDIIGPALGITSKETLKGLQEVKPTESIGGEIVGGVGGLLIPGSPVATAAKVGRGVEAALVSKAAFTAIEKSAARKIMAKGAASAAGGAAEGALYGTGQLISEEALGDAEFNAQNLVSAAGSGAVLGGLVGGAFGTAFGSADELGKVFQKDGKLKRLVQADLDPETNAIKLIAPEGAETVKIMRMARGEVDGVPAFSVRDYLTKDLQLENLTSRQQLFERNALIKSQALDEIKNVVKAVDETAVAPKLNRLELRSRILKETMEDLEKVVELPGARKAAKSELARFIDQALDIDGKARKFANKVELDPLTMAAIPSGATKGVAAKQLHELISGLGEAGFGSGVSKTSSKAFQVAFGKTKDILRELADSSDGAGGLARRWDEANRRFRTALTLEKPLSMRAAADMPLADWKDAILGSAGALVGGPATAAAVIASRRFAKSDLKKKLIVLGSVEKATASSAKRIAEATLNFFTKTARGIKKSSVPLVNQIFFNSGLSQDFSKPRTPIAPTNDKQAFKNMQKNVSEYASNPEKLAKSLSASTQKMDAIAPKTAQAARETMVRAVQFLDSKLPKDRNQPYDLFQSQREFEPSSQLLAKFKRYVQVVEDPYSVLADLESGTATQEHVEALKVVYPAIYSKIRTEMLDYVIKNPTELDFNKKTQLGILLQAPVTPAMRGKSVANLQATFIPKEDGEAGQTVPMTVGGLSNMKIAENESTSIEKIQSGEGS